MRAAFLLSVAAMILTVPVFAAEEGAKTAMDSYTVLKYPETRKTDVADEQFGVKVVDPYRWLEDDVRTSKDVAEWVAVQKAVSDSYLDALPGKAALAAKMKTLYNYERYSLPEKAGGHYFFTKNDGLQNQSVLYVRKGLKGSDRILIDPNTWAKDGATALDSWVASKNGKLLAYAIQDGGSDWRTIKVLNVTTGKPLSDEIQWAKFTNISWVGNEGFLYSRFAAPSEGAAFQQLNYNQTVYFHKIGTPQSADQVVYATPDRKELGHSAEVTQDGRWVVLTSSSGTDEKYELNLIPLRKKRDWKAQPLVTGLDYDWQLIDGVGDKLYFVTNKNAAKLKVVRMDLFNRMTEMQSPCAPTEDCNPDVWVEKDVISERAETLDRAQIVGDRMVLSYLKDAASMAMMTDLNGKPVQQIALNSIGTASGFGGKPGDPETFYAFSSFNQPGAIIVLTAVLANRHPSRFLN